MAGRPAPRIAIVLAVLFVIACGVVLVVVRSLDSVVRTAIEREGPRITGTSVGVGRVRLELRKGRGEFRDLTIGNPDGFSGGDAVRMGEIVLDVDTESLSGSPLTLDEIRVSAPTLRLELDARGASNLERIREQVQSYTPVTRRTSGGSPAPNLVVRRLVFEGAVVQVDARALGGKESEWKLGAVELTDLGGKRGIPADELAKVALETLVREATKRAAKEELGDRLKDAAGRSLGDKAADALGGLLGEGK